MIIGDPQVVDGEVVDQEGNELVCRRKPHQRNRICHPIDAEAFGQEKIRPQCFTPIQKEGERWHISRRSDLKPFWSICERCTGEYSQSEQGTVTGPRLCHILEEMSVEEFDRRAGLDDSWVSDGVSG